MSNLDFSIIPDPMASFQNSFLLGQGIRQNQLKTQEMDQRAEMQRQAMEQVRMQQEALNRVLQPKATAEDYAQLSLFLPPEQAKSARETYSMMEESQQKTALNDTGRVFAAFKSGNTDFAISMLDEQIQALENSGNAQESGFLKAIRKIAEKEPKMAEAYYGYTLATIPGGERVIEKANELAEEKRRAELFPVEIKQKEQELARATTEAERAAIETKYADQLQELDVKKKLADIGFTKAQTNKAGIEAKKLGMETEEMFQNMLLEKDKLSRLPATGQALSEKERSDINNSIIEATKANALSSQYSNLSDDFSTGVQSSGTASQIREWVKEKLGTEDNPTVLRQGYLRLRNSAALQMLPPGVASDKDIEIALAAFPKESASPAVISQFLSGMAKLKRYEAEFNRAQAEWLQQNGTLGRAIKPMEVGGLQVNEGERFDTFMKTYIPDISVQDVVEVDW